MCMYEVECKCGHVGRDNYLVKSFPVYAINKKAAAEKARSIPRVKHNHKDAIIDVKEIDFEKFVELRKTNNGDDYLKCKNIQDQKKLDLSGRIYKEETNVVEPTKEQSRKKLYFRKERIRNPKKYSKIIGNYEKYQEELTW